MKLRKRTVWFIVGLAGGVALLLILFVAAVPLSSDILRHRIVDALSERLNSEVALGDLHLRVFPSMHADGALLVIRERDRPDDVPPLITVKKFSVDANLLSLLRRHVARVTIDGLIIQIPPDDDNVDDVPGRDTDKTVATSGERSNAKSNRDPNLLEHGVIIDLLEAAGAKLVIIPKKKGKEPKVWDIHALQMTNVGALQRMPFKALLTNAVPPGEIATHGTFGPWHTEKPGRTPLRGEFTFDNADLSVFHGISGMLSSHGDFGGSLAQIDVNGETDTPDFTISVGRHPFALQTKYHAVVDGTNGDTRLERIDATFLHSSLVAKGAVLDAPPGLHGRTIALEIEMTHARIEDVMRMAVPTPKPPMVGGLRLTTKFLLPPGETDVAERLRLDGRFAVSNARFTSEEIQQKINDLSRRTRGKSNDAPVQPVSSRFDGRFTLAGGQLQLPELTFDVPGAKVRLAGDYALRRESLDFKGTMLMDAKVSETQSGWKRFLYKMADPVFKQKDGTGSEVPFTIRGTRNDPKFGLDLKAVLRKNKT